MTDPVVIFLHLPKAAGSTLNRVIAQQFPPSAIYRIAGTPSAEVARDLSKRTKEGGPIRVITGHATFGTHAAVAGPFTYITVLRDPVERLISHYHFARNLPSHPLHAEIVSGALPLAKLARRMANLQTRYLADRSVRGTAATASSETLASAKDNLARHFAVAGLVDRFDEMHVLLQRRLGWGLSVVANSNVARGRPARETHSAADLEAICAANVLDLELCDWTRKRFDEEVAAEGLGFFTELAWLRARRFAGNLHRGWSRLHAHQ